MGLWDYEFGKSRAKSWHVTIRLRINSAIIERDRLKTLFRISKTVI